MDRDKLEAYVKARAELRDGVEATIIKGTEHRVVCDLKCGETFGTFELYHENRLLSELDKEIDDASLAAYIEENEREHAAATRMAQTFADKAASLQRKLREVIAN